MSLREMQRDSVAEYDSVLEQLEALDDRRPVLDLAQRLIRIAERLVDAAPTDPDAHQMFGLAWYHFPQPSSWRSWHCRDALGRALSLEPTHPWALKFLGYLHFDQEQYAQALQSFNTLDPGFFRGPHREWELLKILELRQVCQLRLSPSMLPDDFASFASDYENAHAREEQATDLGSTVPLQELPECAEWLFEQGSEEGTIPLKEVLSFLAQYALEISFWNPSLEDRFATLRGTPPNAGLQADEALPPSSVGPRS